MSYEPLGHSQPAPPPKRSRSLRPFILGGLALASLGALGYLAFRTSQSGLTAAEYGGMVESSISGLRTSLGLGPGGVGGDVDEPGTQPGEIMSVPWVGRHSATIIFIHGLGATAHLGLPFILRMGEHLTQTSFELPNAYHLAMTYRGGEKMSSWFDMDSLTYDADSDLPEHEDKDRMLSAVERINKIIDGELDKGIEPGRIVIAGFSQGCAMTLLTALQTPHKLGGMMCLSGWLPLHEEIHKDSKGSVHPLQTTHAHKIPVFWGHGEADSVIPINWGKKTTSLLKDMGFKNIEWHQYPEVDHWVIEDEEADMVDWFKKILPPV